VYHHPFSYTKYPLNALTNLLARNFAEQGGGRRHTWGVVQIFDLANNTHATTLQERSDWLSVTAGVCQGRQHRYADFNAI